jgi:enamine deaminase RidA (YjgF/YER057c/UK114 family)
MKNVEAPLKQAGLEFRYVVMSHVYLDKYENLKAADKVYKEFFEEGSEPACATAFVDWIPGGSHVQTTCIARTDLASRKVVQPAGVKGLSNDGAVTTSPAVWAGNALYISALSGARPQGDLAGQVHQMARNHITVLESAELTLEDIASGCVYLRDMKDDRPMNAVNRFAGSGREVMVHNHPEQSHLSFFDPFVDLNQVGLTKPVSGVGRLSVSYDGGVLKS